MAIVIKETDSKIVARKKNITLKDILVQNIRLVDIDGEDLTEQFKEAVPEGITSVTLKASFELSDED
ncbi:MAG: hypothetical protein KBT35_07955 [Firmicutes bacterium]|nr:hypothetical protein [Candidatus Colivicinus equi]